MVNQYNISCKEWLWKNILKKKTFEFFKKYSIFFRFWEIFNIHLRDPEKSESTALYVKRMIIEWFWKPWRWMWLDWGTWWDERFSVIARDIFWVKSPYIKSLRGPAEDQSTRLFCFEMFWSDWSVRKVLLSSWAFSFWNCN